MPVSKPASLPAHVCYSCRVDERRDTWRPLFQERFSPLIRDAAGISEAALTLNREIWQFWNISFKANQTPNIMSPFQVPSALLVSDLYQIVLWHLWRGDHTSLEASHIMVQVIEAGYASCTGLSIFLVNALRAVGIPARMAGTAHYAALSPLECCPTCIRQPKTARLCMP